MVEVVDMVGGAGEDAEEVDGKEEDNNEEMEKLLSNKLHWRDMTWDPVSNKFTLTILVQPKIIEQNKICQTMSC